MRVAIVASPCAQNNIDEVIWHKDEESGTMDPAHGWRAYVARRIVKSFVRYRGCNTGLQRKAAYLHQPAALCSERKYRARIFCSFFSRRELKAAMYPAEFNECILEHPLLNPKGALTMQSISNTKRTVSNLEQNLRIRLLSLIGKSRLELARTESLWSSLHRIHFKLQFT